MDPYSWIGQDDGRIFFASALFCCLLRNPSILLMYERAQLHNSIYRETNLWMFRKLLVFVCLFMAGTHIGMPGPLTSLERHPPPSAAHSLVCKIRVKITSIKLIIPHAVLFSCKRINNATVKLCTTEFHGTHCILPKQPKFVVAAS